MPGIHYIDVQFLENGKFLKRSGFSSNIFQTDKYYQHYLWHSYSDDAKTCFVAGIDQPPPEYQLTHRKNYENMFNLIIAGEGTVNGTPFRAGQFFTITPGKENTMINNPENPWTICWFSWRGAVPAYFLNVFNRFEPLTVYTANNTEAIFNIFRSLLYCDTYAANVAELTNSFSSLVISFFDKPTSTFIKKRQKLLPQTLVYVDKAKRIISQEYTKITVNDLSNRLHLNRKYFSRIFTEVTGMTPQQYLTDIRLNAGEFYLLETSYSIEQIAAFCGYSSYSSFVQAFQKKFNMSPSKYKSHYK